MLKSAFELVALMLWKRYAARVRRGKRRQREAGGEKAWERKRWQDGGGDGKAGKAMTRQGRHFVVRVRHLKKQNKNSTPLPPKTFALVIIVHSAGVACSPPPRLFVSLLLEL